jgi:hypothetical protein
MQRAHGALPGPDPATDHILGPDSAPVTIVEYGDYACPSCGRAHTAMKMMRDHFVALMCPPQQCQVRVSKVRVEDYLISVSGDVETQIPLA